MQAQVQLMKALGDPTRLKLFKFLVDEELCVCELQELLGVSQPAVSQHLAKLKTTGLLRERRSGMWMYYQVDRERLGQTLDSFVSFLTAPVQSVPEMATELERRRRLNRVQLCCEDKEC